MGTYVTMSHQAVIQRNCYVVWIGMIISFPLVKITIHVKTHQRVIIHKICFLDSWYEHYKTPNDEKWMPTSCHSISRRSHAWHIFFYSRHTTRNLMGSCHSIISITSREIGPKTTSAEFGLSVRNSAKSFAWRANVATSSPSSLSWNISCCYVIYVF